MTLKTNARIAGIAFLLYIVAGMATMALGRQQPQAKEILVLVTSLCALTLGVTLYALTRTVDADLALLALTCRVIEAIPGREGAIFFAVGSTIFCWLFLRGRLIPTVLAWLGIAASVLLVIVLPLHVEGWWIWMPMLAFEVTLAVWLLTKGVRAP